MNRPSRQKQFALGIRLEPILILVVTVGKGDPIRSQQVHVVGRQVAVVFDRLMDLRDHLASLKSQSVKVDQPLVSFLRSRIQLQDMPALLLAFKRAVDRTEQQ